VASHEKHPLQNITAPTLVIYAADDTLVPFAQGQYSAEHIPGARLVSFAQGGHLVVAKDGVWDEVRQFIAQNE
jgi:pimeloyl-ACP methyl ester carboxylesterase